MHILLTTHIYIDGYNLYCSRLKGTAFKWLDLVALFRDEIVLQQDPSAQVQAIKFLPHPSRPHMRATAKPLSMRKRSITEPYWRNTRI
jgi:hypothetical protein